MQAAWGVLGDEVACEVHRTDVLRAERSWTPPVPPRPPPRPDPRPRERPDPPPPRQTTYHDEPRADATPSARARVAIQSTVADRGGRVLVRLPVSQPCPSCGGAEFERTRCPMCRGRGVVTMRLKAWVTVPPGVRAGDRRVVLAELELYGERAMEVEFRVDPA